MQRLQLRRELQRTGVYKIQHIKPGGKFYVGSGNLLNRFISHKSALQLGDHCNYNLQEEWELYGGDNFYFIVLEYCEPCDMRKKEQRYLNLYWESGLLYNISPWAHAGNNSRPVCCYNDKGFVREFKSAQEASEYHGVYHSAITTACIKGTNSCGLFWKYKYKKRKPSNRIKGPRLYVPREVNCYDVDGNFIKSFNSMKEGAKHYGISTSTEISRVCQGRNLFAGGVRWTYAEEELVIRKDMRAGHPREARPVVYISPSGEEKKFKSISEAGRYYGIPKSTIYKWVTNHFKCRMEGEWEYV